VAANTTTFPEIFPAAAVLPDAGVLLDDELHPASTSAPATHTPASTLARRLATSRRDAWTAPKPLLKPEGGSLTFISDLLP
jgi:hypothetical protein